LPGILIVPGTRHPVSSAVICAIPVPSVAEPFGHLLIQTLHVVI
jgi:hypothetical protein